MIGVVFATSEVIREKIAFGPLIDFISMTDVDAIYVCYPHSEDVCLTEEESVKRFGEIGVKVAAWQVLWTA